MLDPQILLDPFEKQLDLPAALVETADRRCGQCHLVGQEHQGFRRTGVAEPDPAQMDRVVLAGLHAIERDGLVGDDAGASISGRRIHPVCVEVGFGARDKERASLLQSIQAGKVDIAAIHA